MNRILPTVLLGKTIRRLARLRGGGSALPGLVVERLQPNFLHDALAQLPRGVVVVTGTNGKTTTTKMIAELLTAQGLRVLTNRTGSNFTRGIVAAVVEHMSLDGRLDYDIAVIELDEAYARRFVQKITPSVVVALNVMRDQLDRFGEIDTIARILTPVLEAATQAAVINSDDPLLAMIGDQLESEGKTVRYFGVSDSLRAAFPTDDELQAKVKKTRLKNKTEDVTLESLNDHTATYRVDGKKHNATLRLSGNYNFQNSAAALAAVRAVLPDSSTTNLMADLAQIEPAFGRGEKIIIHGQPVELVLVKNPAGFRLSLASFAMSDRSYLIAINDAYADGRDMSWLWDVDFSCLQDSNSIMISGARAYDMALRLQYDEVMLGDVEPSIRRAVHTFLHASDGPKVLFCSYTAMLAVRRELKKYAATLERAL